MQMRKIIKTIILALLVFCFFTFEASLCSAESNRVIDVFGEKYVQYDANADGCFDIRDLVRVKTRIAGKKKTINLMAADANQDGFINSVDLSIIRKLLLEAE